MELEVLGEEERGKSEEVDVDGNRVSEERDAVVDDDDDDAPEHIDVEVVLNIQVTEEEDQERILNS